MMLSMARALKDPACLFDIRVGYCTRASVVPAIVFRNNLLVTGGKIAEICHLATQSLKIQNKEDISHPPVENAMMVLASTPFYRHIYVLIISRLVT
jgi:hypothetical protein